MTQLYFEGVATSAASGTVTLTIPVESGGSWPKYGITKSLTVRMTAGSATKYAWGLYSENPAALPAGTEAWEFLVAGAFDASGFGGTDDRVEPSATTTIPDIAVEFDHPKPWRPKSSATPEGNFYLTLTPDTASDNVWRAIVVAGPGRIRLSPGEVPV